MALRRQTLDFGITAVDVDFVRPGLASSHILWRDGEAALVDVGTALAAPGLLAVLDDLGIARRAVRYLFVTHVHLDHAGGAGTLMQALPQARVVAHPRAARHLADPSRLWAGATAVYGEAEMARLYGSIVPVDAGSIVEAPDGFEVELAGDRLTCLDVPGHARHHYALLDPRSDGIFSGDTFGMAYRELDTPGGRFVMPTTTPVQFDPAALHASIDRLLAQGPARMYLTHYSELPRPQAAAPRLHALIDAHVEATQRAVRASAPEATLRAAIEDLLLAALAELGCPLDVAEQRRLLELDIGLNAQGCLHWWHNRP